MIRSIAGARLAAGLFCAATLVLPDLAAAQPVPRFRPEPTPIFRSYNKEADCLAKAVYFEARGEPLAGQKAVAKVVLNRVDSAYYPSTVCDVVYQNDHMANACQFSFACDGIPDRISEPHAYRTAQLVAAKSLGCGEACSTPAGSLARSTHYHADFVSPWWAKKLERTGQVGRHIFYYTASM